MQTLESPPSALTIVPALARHKGFSCCQEVDGLVVHLPVVGRLESSSVTSVLKDSSLGDEVVLSGFDCFVVHVSSIAIVAIHVKEKGIAICDLC